MEWIIFAHKAARFVDNFMIKYVMFDIDIDIEKWGKLFGGISLIETRSSFNISWTVLTEKCFFFIQWIFQSISIFLGFK